MVAAGTEVDHTATVPVGCTLQEYADRLKYVLEHGSPHRFSRVTITEYFMNYAELEYVGRMYTLVDPAYNRGRRA